MRIADGEREGGDQRQCAAGAGAEQPDPESGLAGGGAGKELAEGDEVAVFAVVEPAAAFYELGAEVAEVCDRPAEGGCAEFQEDSEHLPCGPAGRPGQLLSGVCHCGRPLFEKTFDAPRRGRFGCFTRTRLRSFRRRGLSGGRFPDRSSSGGGGANSPSMGLPAESSKTACRPPGPLMMTPRKWAPASSRRAMSASMSSTMNWVRFHPPAVGVEPSGSGRPSAARGSGEDHAEVATLNVGECGQHCGQDNESEVLGVEVDASCTSDTM